MLYSTFTLYRNIWNFEERLSVTTNLRINKYFSHTLRIRTEEALVMNYFLTNEFFWNYRILADSFTSFLEGFSKNTYRCICFNFPELKCLYVTFWMRRYKYLDLDICLLKQAVLKKINRDYVRSCMMVYVRYILVRKNLPLQQLL